MFVSYRRKRISSIIIASFDVTDFPHADTVFFFFFSLVNPYGILCLRGMGGYLVTSRGGSAYGMGWDNLEKEERLSLVSNRGTA